MTDLIGGTKNIPSYAGDSIYRHDKFYSDEMHLKLVIATFYKSISNMSQSQHQEPPQVSDVSVKEPQEQKLNEEPPVQQDSLHVTNQTESGDKGEIEGKEPTEVPEDLEGTASGKAADNTEQKEKEKPENPSKEEAEKPELSTEATAIQLETTAEEEWTRQNLFDDPVWKRERPTSKVKIVLPATNPLPILFVFAGPPEECIWTSKTLAWHPLKKRSGEWCRTYANLHNSASEAHLDLNRVYMVDAWPYKVWHSSTRIDHQDLVRGKEWIFKVAISLKIRIVVLFHSQLRLCMTNASGPLSGLEKDFAWIITRHPSQQSLARQTQKDDLLKALQRVHEIQAEVELYSILEAFQSYRFTGREPEELVELFDSSDEKLTTKDLYTRSEARNPDLIKNNVTSQSQNITIDSFRNWLNDKASHIVTLTGHSWNLTASGKSIKEGSDTDGLEDGIAKLNMKN